MIRSFSEDQDRNTEEGKTMKMLIKNARCSYPKLFKAEPFDQNTKEGNERYSCSLLIAKTESEQIKAINDAIVGAAKAAYKDKAKTMLTALRANPQKYCFRDGDTAVNKQGEPVAPGYYVLAAHRRKADGAPTVVGRDRKPLSEDSGKPYAGCYVNASVEIWAQEGQYAGIRCTLLGVQFAEDGEAFGGSRPASPGDFESLADEADEADDDLGDFS